MTEDSPSNCPKEKPRSHMALSNLGLEVTQHNSVPFTKLVVKTSWCQGSQTETPPHDRRDIKAIQDRFFKTTQSQRHTETSSCLSWLLRSNFFSFCLCLRRKYCQVKRNKQGEFFQGKNAKSRLKHRNFCWLGETLYLNDLASLPNVDEAPRDPGAPWEALKKPGSLSPDLPEGITSVHKTCRLDFLFSPFPVFFSSYF